MGKIIICVVILGMCFGLGEETTRCVTLSMPLSMYLGQSVRDNSLLIQKFLPANHISSSNYVNPNVILLQIEGDSLQPKTSFWKQTGIYGLELLSGGIPATLLVPVVTVFIVEGDPEYWHYHRWPILYSAGNSLLTSTCTWGIGRLLKQKGSWWKAAVGAGLGGFISGYFLTSEDSIKEGVWAWTLVIGLPASGAVIGFNF